MMPSEDPDNPMKFTVKGRIEFMDKLLHILVHVEHICLAVKHVEYKSQNYGIDIDADLHGVFVFLSNINDKIFRLKDAAQEVVKS